MQRRSAEVKEGEKARPAAAKAPTPPKPAKIDLAGIENRIVALPLPAGDYLELVAGKPGTLYFRQAAGGNRFAERTATLSRFVFDTRKTEKLAERVASFDLSADGEKMLLALLPESTSAGRGAGAGPARPTYVIVSRECADQARRRHRCRSPICRCASIPQPEWNQMYHEVWRVERSYFYDPNFHGVNTVEERENGSNHMCSRSLRAAT